MSDIDDYNSYDSDSDSSIEEKPLNNKQTNKSSLNIDGILEDDTDSDNDKNLNDEEDSESENEKYGGGDEDDDDNEEIISDDDDEDIVSETENENTKSKKSTQKTNIKTTKTPLILDENNDSDEDDDYDETYLQKFDRDINKNYIEEYHPECIMHNYDEIANLTRVVRDKDNIIIDDLHRTIPYLTKYERAKIIGQRAKQIEHGAKPFINVPENIIEGSIIAELELQQKRIPFIIRRPLPCGGCEYWNLKDLEIINY